MAKRLLSIAMLPIVIATFLMLDCSILSAEGFHYGSGYNYPYDVPVYGQRFGGGSIQGYNQNPYASGSFKAPDLLNDPLFQAEHKFDSRFPGRYNAADRVKYRNPETETEIQWWTFPRVVWTVVNSRVSPTSNCG